ncbi:MAG: rod shape-determining protein MreC [Thermoanaerobaculales bacterium]|nr:rod shape-determining protein MreC [Thermoanaerobaculales bacterium]
MTDRRILLLRTALLWILLELLAAAQVRSSSGDPVLWGWTRAAVAPLIWAGTTVGSSIAQIATVVTRSAELASLNRQLELELEAARTMRRIIDEDRAAQRELGSLIARLPEISSTAVPARTVFRDLERGLMIVELGGGRRIDRDSPAVASGGVVGRVIRSEGRRCWIELVTHPVAAIAVQTPDGRVQALAVGSRAGELELQFVPRTAELLRGDELVTSGADGIYPPGLPVGRVSSVRESAEAFLDIRAEPAADLATNRVVLLLDDRTVAAPVWSQTR